jgi:hypothetical protein
MDRERLSAGFVIAVVLLAMAGFLHDAVGQGIRGWVGTTIQLVELRPVGMPEDGCLADVPCYLPVEEQLAVAVTQELSLTSWGLGVQGLSATVFLRGRAGLGSGAVWPRTQDHFDALLANAQFVRGPWTVRAGRQELRSGLGFSSFDGASATWRIRSVLLQGYGGRSLARGLRDPANEALRGIEDFVPDQSVYLWGGSARGRLRTLSLTARYQREILSDRSGLASERASIAWSAALPRVRLTGEIDYDFGIGRPGKGHISASVPISGGRWMISATARRYLPYFSLLTIWGFFEPVPYHETQLRIGWSGSTAVGVWLSGGWRKYGETATSVVLRPLQDTGWRGAAGAVWRLAPAWSVEAGYRMEWGPGGFLSSGDGVVRWSVHERLALALSLTSFQQIDQYRLGDGRAVGAGLSFDVGLTERLTFDGGASLLRQAGVDDRGRSPWNQSRAWSSVRVQLGRDPGLANGARR